MTQDVSVTCFVTSLKTQQKDAVKDPKWRRLPDSNNVIAGAKGRNKCVCLNVPQITISKSSPWEIRQWRGWEVERAGVPFQINKRVRVPEWGLPPSSRTGSQRDGSSERRPHRHSPSPAPPPPPHPRPSHTNPIANPIAPPCNTLLRFFNRHRSTSSPCPLLLNRVRTGK